jgi:hypothetical protein
MAIIVAGSVFVLVGAALAINWRGFARHLANWANGLDDRWYFLPETSLVMARTILRLRGCLLPLEDPDERGRRRRGVLRARAGDRLATTG